MRNITSHIVNPANDKLTITAVDEPGAGGANHAYCVTGADLVSNPSVASIDHGAEQIVILFQNGPIAEHGVNGITQEVLLAIVADRLDSFQKGPFACQENEDALRHVESALGTLLQRTKDRMARGVEGTNEK